MAPISYAVLQLVFKDGRLAERRAIELPANKVLWRESYASDGTVTLTDDEGKLVYERKLRSEPAREPNLKPDGADALVILPMPTRTAQHVRNSIQPRLPGKDIGQNYADLTDDEAYALAGGMMNQQGAELHELIGQRFFAKGDRRIGFYVLILANQSAGQLADPLPIRTGKKVSFNVLADHPGSILARYVNQQIESQRRGDSVDLIQRLGEPEDGFVHSLSAMRYWQMQCNNWYRGDENQRRARSDALIGDIRRMKSPVLGLCLLGLARNYANTSEMQRSLGELAPLWARAGFSYVARYELARAAVGTDPKGARAMFEQLYRETLDRGLLPRIDGSFRQAFWANDGQAWQEFVRNVAAELAKRGRRAQVPLLAWQCSEFGDQALADELVTAALGQAEPKQRVVVTLSAIQYLSSRGQASRADRLIQSLLDEPEHKDKVYLWRLGSLLAEQNGRQAVALARQERAMELEFADLPELVNLETLRQEYGQVLGRYYQLAMTISSLQAEPPRELLARTVRLADRWRAIDTDDTAACQAAARVLQAAGAGELAWEYLTTPLAEHGAEAAPWVALAAELRNQGSDELADRAYESAFAAEPTNAQILWDRAMLLKETGQDARARELFGRIAEGKWQPRFAPLAAQARQYAGSGQ